MKMKMMVICCLFLSFVTLSFSFSISYLCDCCIQQYDEAKKNAIVTSKCLESCAGVGTFYFQIQCHEKCIQYPEIDANRCCQKCNPKFLDTYTAFHNCISTCSPKLFMYPVQNHECNQNCLNTVIPHGLFNIQCMYLCSGSYATCAEKCSIHEIERIFHAFSCCGKCQVKFSKGSNAAYRCCEMCELS